MKKLASTEYQQLFLRHVESFLLEKCPDYLGSNVLVSVSGGVDSMVLLEAANRLLKTSKIKSLRAIYCHHQTRTGQDQEQSLVQNYCYKNQIPFVSIKLVGLEGASNFEQKARKLRKNALMSLRQKNERIWQGHHLDDSFEWSMMQRFKSSNPSSQLGIPVLSGKIFRPFMCVTKAQIQKFAHFSNTPFLTDPTNFDPKIERNYFRLNILPGIKKRYPKYLKHYAQSSEAKISNLKIKSLMTFEDGFCLHPNELDYKKVIPLMQKLSNVKRGKWSQTFFKMKKAVILGKPGPYDFSGGVKAYLIADRLIFFRFDLAKFDQYIVDSLQKKTFNQVPSTKKSVISLFDIAMTNSENFFKSQIKVFPSVSRWISQNNMRMEFVLNAARQSKDVKYSKISEEVDLKAFQR